ncbi:MAG: PAS domain-containing hybrid sensor histidine kinase/response regulator [Fibrobacterota bacterium]
MNKSKNSDQSGFTKSSPSDASETKFRRIFSHTTIGIALVSLDYRIINANAAYCQMLGYNEKEIIGMHIKDLTHPDIIAKNLDMLSRLVSGEIQHVRMEKQYIHKSGVPVYGILDVNLFREADDQPPYFIASFLDITERKHAELKLRSALDELTESEKRYRSLFENDHTIMLLIEPSTGRIIDANPAAVAFYGWSRDQLRSKNIDDINSLTRDELHHELDAARQGKRNCFYFQHRLSNGDVRDVEVYSGAVRLMGRDLLYSFIYDITARRELETRLRQAEKMEAIGKLAGGIAHDFNNILGAIIGYADISLDEVAEQSRLEKNIKQVLKAADRAKHLVRQILSFSRQSSDIKTAIHIRPILEEVVLLLRASLPSTIDIKTDFTPDSKPVMANATKVHEIVMNLCTNAAHAMNDKGVLEIIHTEDVFTEEFRGKIGISPPGLYSVIIVRDNGNGIPSHVQSRIFEPYYTTKPVGEGTGMGLAVVFGIVMDHGGNILVTSNIGEGTEFRILLPKSDEEPVLDKAGNRQLRGGHENILLVDDEEVLCEMYKEMLTSLGYSVSAFTDSTEAYRSFKQRPDKYDLVITDQTMPTMTGIELSERLLRIRKNIPVILCTGFSKHVDRKIASNAGIRAFCKKPLRMNDIAYHIRLVLDKA